MKFNKILIDVSNVYWKAYSTSSNMSFSDENNELIVTGGIFTTIRSVNKISREYLSEDGTIYFLFDATHKKPSISQLDSVPSRKEIDPEYKANRKAQDDVFYWGMSKLQEIFMNHSDNFKLVEIPGLEADDLVKPILDHEITPTDKVLLVSEDKDWGRGISDNVYWLNYKKQVLNRDSYNDIHGFYPDENRLTIYKSFRGDAGDGIPKGVSGMREKDLLLLLGTYTDLDSIFDNVNSIESISDNWKKKILENKARIKLNYTLVDYLPISKSLFYEFLFESRFNQSALRLIYKSLNFRISEIDKRLMNYANREKPKSMLGFRSVSRA